MLKLSILGLFGLFMWTVNRWVRWHLLKRREQRVLQQKYGDLPMFEDFFRRLGQEGRHRAR